MRSATEEAWDVHLTSEPFDPTGSLVFLRQHETSRYERYNRVTVFASTMTMQFHYYRFDPDAQLTPPAGTYRLIVQDQSGETVNSSLTWTQASGSSTLVGSFSLDASALPAGWLSLDIDAEGLSIPASRYNVFNAKAGYTSDRMPAAHGSWELSHGQGAKMTWLPTRFTPNTVPLEARTVTHFSQALSHTLFHRHNLVPVSHVTSWRPNKTVDGVWNTANTQSYFYGDLVRQYPVLPQLDGARGRGCVAMATHLQVAFNGDIIFATPWRIGRVDRLTGAVRTIVGWRHAEPVNFSNAINGTGKELVGDWSLVSGPHGLHEVWGFAWDGVSIEVPPNTDPDVVESPHLADPVMYITDTQNNRVVRITFDRLSHETPVFVEEVAAFDDPWDIVWLPTLDKFMVSERGRDALVLLDRDGTKTDFLVGPGNLAHVDSNRLVVRDGTLQQCRDADIVLPEGLAEQDGYVYWGSFAQKQIRRVNLSTEAIEIVIAEPRTDDNSVFIKIAVGDGSFGPRGTVFNTSWTLSNSGYPDGYIPSTGTSGFPVWSLWPTAELGYPHAGAGGQWAQLGYGAAMAAGKGRLACAASEEGICVITKTQPTDDPVDGERYEDGRVAYEAAGYKMTHGVHGYGFAGLPWPAGLTDDMKYYLRVNGHDV